MSCIKYNNKAIFSFNENVMLQCLHRLKKACFLITMFETCYFSYHFLYVFLTNYMKQDDNSYANT